MKTRFVLCYDISDPRRLRRVAKLMLAHGQRVQKSVFECELTERQLAGLLTKARRMLNEKQDSLRVYRLCPCAATHEKVANRQNTRNAGRLATFAETPCCIRSFGPLGGDFDAGNVQ